MSDISYNNKNIGTMYSLFSYRTVDIIIFDNNIKLNSLLNNILKYNNITLYNFLFEYR